MPAAFAILLLHALLRLVTPAAGVVPTAGLLPASDSLTAFQFDNALPPNDPLTTVVPFIRAGNLVIVKGRADTLSGNFILDTGAPGLVLNLIYFRDLPATHTGEFHNGIGGEGSAILQTRLQNFNLGEFNYPSAGADLVDLGNIENAKGLRILGLIGLSLLEGCEVVIDYEQSLLHLRRVPRRETAAFASQRLLEDSSYSTLPFDVVDRKIVAQSQGLGGKKLRFVLDSGAETNILDSRLPNRVFEHVQITGQLNIRGTNRTTVKALTGEVDELRIGSVVVSRLPVAVANLEQTCFSAESCADGVLGLGFMPLRKIGFNFVTRKMYLWK